MFKNYPKLWLALGALILLSPLGLMATGTAFGEWSLDELLGRVGFIPAGLERYSDLWIHSPLPDYAVPGMDTTFMQAAAGYIFSALIGGALVFGIISLLSKSIRD